MRHSWRILGHASLVTVFAASSCVAIGCAGTGSGDGLPSLDGGNGSDHDGTVVSSEGGHTSVDAHDAGHDAVSVGTGGDAGNDSSPHADAQDHADAPQISSADAAPDAANTMADSGADAPSSEDAHVDASGIADASVHHDASSTQIPVVYGQSAGTLYSLNTMTDAVTAVGNFPGCDSSGVIDIALDKDSNMYATTFDGVYTVNTSTSACTLLHSGSYPNSLSFVPAGTVDPNVEALVGYQGSTYVRINTTSGALTTIGSLGGTTYSSSGDVVSVIGGATYLTVTGGTNCSSNDCLVEVNPTTGALIMNYGSVQHSSVFGLAFWAGDVYGFDSGGDLFRVSFPDAGGLAITTIPIPGAPAGLSFYGAGSTTAAPKR